MQTLTPLSTPEPRWSAGPVPGIDPVGDWTLCYTSEDDGDGFTTNLYIARGPDRDVALCVSRFSFTPTQARFDWLVRNNFPRPQGIGPWNNLLIDAAMAAEAVAA